MIGQLGTIPIEPIGAFDLEGLCDIVEIGGHAGKTINEGRCWRYSDLAKLDFGASGRCGISLFKAELRTLPLRLDLMERHPFGSQAFVPMDRASLLVVVSADDGGRPGQPKAFVAGPDQAVNIHRNVWHGVLTPLSGSGLFAVFDWIGEDPNLEIHTFDQPFEIRPAE